MINSLLTRKQAWRRQNKTAKRQEQHDILFKEVQRDLLALVEFNFMSSRITNFQIRENFSAIEFTSPVPLEDILPVLPEDFYYC